MALGGYLSASLAPISRWRWPWTSAQSPRTTMLYDRRQEEISLDEVERIAI